MKWNLLASLNISKHSIDYGMDKGTASLSGMDLLFSFLDVILGNYPYHSHLVWKKLSSLGNVTHVEN
jgi:hypothetical protein